jgi:hypothetical protein
MIPRDQFVAAVRSCIGTPFVHQGRAIGTGLDWVGVPWAAAVACGLELAPTRTYGLPMLESDLAAALQGFADRVDEAAAAHVWQVRIGGVARHLAVPVGVNGCGQSVVVAAGPYAKHKRPGHVVESVLVDPIAACWRIRGIE